MFVTYFFLNSTLELFSYINIYLDIILYGLTSPYCCGEVHLVFVYDNDAYIIAYDSFTLRAVIPRFMAYNEVSNELILRVLDELRVYPFYSTDALIEKAQGLLGER